MTLMRLLIKDCIQVIFAAEFDTLKCMVGVRCHFRLEIEPL